MAFLDFLPVIGDVIGAIGDVIGQNSANEANLQATRETNANQYKMFKEQMSYQTAEREATQEYNTPLNQRLRYEEAGFSPYMAMGNITGGNSTAQTAPAAPSLNVPHVEALPYGNMFRNFGNDLLNSANVNAVNLDNDAKRIDLTYKTQEKLLDIDTKIADLENRKQQTEHTRQLIDNLKAERDTLLENLDILKDTKDERKRQVKLQSKRMELDNDIQELQKDYQAWQNEFAKRHGEKELKVLDSQIASNLASANLSNKQAILAAAETAVKKAEEQGVKLSNQEKRMLRGHVLKMAQLEERNFKLNGDLTEYNTGLNGRDWLNAGKSVIGTVVGAAAGYAAGKHGSPNVQSVKAVPRVPTVYY